MAEVIKADAPARRNATEHKIGTTTYIVTRSFQQNAKEDAATKMARIVQNQTRKLMREGQSSF